jgi:hypothetical protein
MQGINNHVYLSLAQRKLSINELAGLANNPVCLHQAVCFVILSTEST